MKLQITWSEKKSPDWIVATLKDTEAPNLVYDNASINRVGKKGEVFPGFDAIFTGNTIEGEPWKSASGKWYIFPAKVPATGQNRASGAISKAMDRKEAGIEKTMDRKEEGIMTSSTMRMAVDISLQETIALPFDVGVFKGRINFWREWLIANWSLPEEK